MSKRILYLGLDPTHYQANGEVTHWPIIQIVPRPLWEPPIYEALSNFQQYSHIIVTSKSTVTILKDYLSNLAIDLETWAAKATLAVGQVTAKHLEACGINPLRVAQEETAEGIIHELKQLPLEQSHVFWPHSSQARPIIKEFLVAHHICHTTCILYDPKPLLLEQLPSLENFDEIVFTSPSTVEAFQHFFKKVPNNVQLVAIGPITARSLNKWIDSDRHLKS